MKKLLIAIFSLIFCASISTQKVDALEYNGTLGYRYTASSTRFYYLTDKENAVVKVVVEDNQGTFKSETPMTLENGVYVGATGASLNDRYYFNVCDASSNCVNTIDPFSPYLNNDGTRNIVLDTSSVDSEWGNISSTAVEDSKKSIYALDVGEFVKNLDDPVVIGKSEFSVFEKMTYPVTKGKVLVGPEYLRNLGFTFLEMDGLYNKNGYQSVNPEHSTKSNDLSALMEYQAMIKLYKEYKLNVIMKTNFSNVNPILKNALLNVSSTSVVNDKLNFSDPIVKRYINEVYTRWAKDYNIDGFYIEDASEYGNEYLESIKNLLWSVEPGMFIYGKGANMTYTASDEMQELLLGSLNSIDGKGIVNGVYSENDLKKLNELMFGGHYTSREGYEAGAKTINNFGSSQGLDVYSKVEASLGIGANDTNIKNAIKMALYTVYTSVGIPRVVSGNEFLNTTDADNSVPNDYKVCVTSSICYAMGEYKDINWEYLLTNGNIAKIMGNYRKSYSYQFPSMASFEKSKSIELNEEYLSKGVLFITFTYDAREDGDIEKSMYIMNYSFDDVDLSKISDKAYVNVSPLIGRIREVDGKTRLNGLTFFTYTEVKVVNIPQWVFVVVGVGLVALIIGIRQLGIYLLKKKRGIDYHEIQNQNRKGFFRNRKVDLTKEPSIVETFLIDDPLVKEKKKELEKARKEKKAKKMAEKKAKEAEKKETQNKDKKDEKVDENEKGGN